MAGSYHGGNILIKMYYIKFYVSLKEQETEMKWKEFLYLDKYFFSTRDIIF